MASMALALVLLAQGFTLPPAPAIPRQAARAPVIRMSSQPPKDPTPPRTASEMVGDFVESVGDLAEAEARKEKARRFVANDGFWQPADLELIADDFVFTGPTVGPLNKADYLNTAALLAVYESFPDLQVKASAFVQDPEDEDRFWGVVRVMGTHTAPQKLGGALPTIPATRNKLHPGPQVVSVSFDQKGLVRGYTAGLVADGGQGPAGAYGGFYAVLRTMNVPLPPPEALELLRVVGDSVKDFPKARSHRDDLPGKWKAQGRTTGLRTKDAWSQNRFKVQVAPARA